MLDSLLHPSKEDAINILKEDHDTVKSLFKEFKDKNRTRSKAVIIAEALKELRIHAAIEEEIFYPAVRPGIEKDLMNEANEEHHVAKFLIAEIAVMTGKEEHYDAKFIVLSENIEHHIKEEEHDMFPKARSLDIDMIALGKKMLARKEDLKKNGVPATAEEKLLLKVGATSIDSPAKAVSAHKTTKAKTRKPANSNAKKTAAKRAALKANTKKLAVKSTPVKKKA